ncbi:SAM-dependent methyltransferase [Ideonella azotifigens]|uniref:SAM-dependent methyltransferase n=1 Tax=Ideonella azotifigens TaxID=513160 RepID=A0ABP3V1Z3_9BURK|nr:SAM-dependent methyltransferase [Ideonella azotifigens]MCD2340087.1 SAM-dependent methyltransferase [Ideonella azotifigens]
MNPIPEAAETAAETLRDEPAALADLARRERFLQLLADSLSQQTLTKLVLSKPRNAGDLQRVTARPLALRGEACLSLLWHHQTKDITKNPAVAEGLKQVDELLGSRFFHALLFTTTDEWQLMVSKRGKMGLTRRALAAPAEAAEATGHAREKQRYLALELPFLQDLGVTDTQARLVPAMARKWKQINKFVEVLDHALDGVALHQPGRIRVVDFGAGKGYLTFATHQHLAHGRGLQAEVTGVELRPDMVDLCNAAARRREMHGLQFLCGDVRSHVPEQLDVMIALHACDTATDFALHTGIRAGAALILSSPCCHKQIRPQMTLPPLLRPMLQHGIHLGQQAEMVTDSLRALLLEAEGYDAQVFEFVALEHTSKNKMILAARRQDSGPAEDARRAAARQQVAELKAFYGVREHCLETMLATTAEAAPEPFTAG